MTFWRPLPWFCAALAAAACGGPAPQESSTASADPAPINDVRNRYIAAYNAGDAAALAALYTDDAVSLPDHRPAVEGRAAIQKDFEQVFSTYSTNITITPADTEITGDLAHEHGAFSVTLTPKAGGSPITETGKYLVILERQATGEWRIHHDIDNTSTPPPGAGAAGGQPSQSPGR